MSGAIINTINIRLDAKTISFILRHSKLNLFCRYKFLPVIRKSLKITKQKINIIKLKIIKILKYSKEKTYEDFLKKGSDNINLKNKIKNEWSPISLSYTSGTTQAKGVTTHHRGAI